MAFLSCGPVEVEVSEASQPESDVVGKEERMFAGNLRSSRRLNIIKRNWNFTAPFMTPDELIALQQQAPDGSFREWKGDALGDVVRCRVIYSDISYDMDGNVFKRTPRIALKEA